MSDDELQRAATAGSTEEDDSRADESISTRFPLLKKRKGKSLSELRHPRQKFCARWELEFPWLKADRVDQSLGYCTICSKHLVCKKSHLERHQDSYRHIRMQMQIAESNADEATTGLTDSEVVEAVDSTETEFLECGNRRDTEEEDDYVEYDAEFDQEIDVDQSYDIEFQTIKPAQEIECQQQPQLDSDDTSTSLPIKTIVVPPKAIVKSTTVGKIDRLKLLKQIDHDRHQLSEYLYERRKQSLPSSTCVSSPKVQYQPHLQMQIQRDPFDLFFESVSATVKTLPPKLAAEVKSRVSQIIAEFELRAICEREAQESAAAAGNVEHTVVVTANSRRKSDEHTTTATIDASSLPNIVYTFQPKMHD